MSFTREWPVAATRKQHRCDTCGKHIEIGQPATRWAGMTDGEFGNAIMHPDCRAAEVEFNDLLDFRWGDDWTPLRDIESDYHEWLRDEHPNVAARLLG